MTTALAWSVAFARQARADFDCWIRLARLSKPAISQSQRLHFLQMACEKLAKAQLYRRKGANPLELQASHGGRRPDNCEYPWDDGAGRILVPAEHRFEALRLVDQQGGPQILKIVE